MKAIRMSREDLGTAGETLLGRVLEKETRNGAPHYKPGQHQAVTYGDHIQAETGRGVEVARLTYVDQMGHACVVVCIREPGGAWEATWVGRAGQVTQEPATRADGFVLSDRMLAALGSALPA